MRPSFFTQARDLSAPDEEAEYAPLRPQSSAPASSSMMLVMLAGAFVYLSHLASTANLYEPRPAPDPSAPDQAPEVTTTAPEPEATPHPPHAERPDLEVGYFDVPGFPENPYSKRAKLDHV